MTDSQIPPPHWLRLELSIGLSSRREHESDGFGWDSWYGSIIAGWDTDDDSDLDSSLRSASAGKFARQLVSGDGELTLHIGGCEFMVLRLDEAHPVFGKEVTVGSYGADIFDAGDALSQDLADILGPLTDDAQDEPFADEIMRAAEVGWYDSLVLLRSIGIHELFRGQRIGAWAAARGIMQLATSDTSLVALKSAPLSRTEFLESIGVADSDSYRDLTPAESAAWDAACARIGANWQQTLGLLALTSHPTILYAPGGMNEALAATLRRP